MLCETMELLHFPNLLSPLSIDHMYRFTLPTQDALTEHFLANAFILYTSRSRFLTTLKSWSLENIVGEGENAGNQHFFFFFHNVSTLQKHILML